MKRVIVLLLLLVATAHAENAKRKVIVLEYRAGSSALTGIATRIATAIGKQTSLQILGPDQTRAVYGEHLEQVIVKCGGEAECIAKIGQKIGAAEVILVGISELGDVILTMQRIDVTSHEVAGRIAESLAADAAPTDAQLDGYLQRLLPPSDFVRYGVIDIVANMAGATVKVGGKVQGTTPVQPLTLHAPASYDIRVEKTGFVPFKTRVDLPPDGRIKVEANLSKKGTTAWYAHWYVIAGAGLLAAGAAGTTIYFATQSGGDRVGLDGELR
jgi:hypothetical protein